ncbi:MAG: hypothetical protein ACLPID_06435 [Beijerinckiaceae bacterium]
MIAKDSRVARAMLRYFPLGIAFISLLVSVATYFNTGYHQDREREHQELLIRPQLSFFVSSEYPSEKTHRLSLSLRNDGLGPAVIQEVVAEADGKCYSSSHYKTFREWAEIYSTVIVPQFNKELTEGAKAQSSSRHQIDAAKGYFAEASKMVVPKTTQRQTTRKGTDENRGVIDKYEAYDVYGVETLDSTYSVITLGLGAIVPSGGSLDLAEVRTEWTSRVSKIERRAQSDKGISLSPEVPSESSAVTMTPIALLDKLGIGFGYCSFSGMSCYFIWQGSPKCFEAAKTAD